MRETLHLYFQTLRKQSPNGIRAKSQFVGTKTSSLCSDLGNVIRTTHSLARVFGLKASPQKTEAMHRSTKPAQICTFNPSPVWPAGTEHRVPELRLHNWVNSSYRLVLLQPAAADFLRKIFLSMNIVTFFSVFVSNFRKRCWKSSFGALWMWKCPGYTDPEWRWIESWRKPWK